MTKIKAIKDIGILTCASPLPIVFTEVKGVETFASDFYIKYKSDSGENEKIKITPNLYSKIKGPYNRRNIYGAAISYGPVLPDKLWKSVLEYGLCNDVLKSEMQIPVTTTDFEIEISTRTLGRDDIWHLKANCN
ncbi:MAG: hypothetical protein V3V14_01050 [Saprospiraceae bacterium]